MDTRTKGRLGSIKEDINNLYLDKGIKPDEKVAVLRDIARYIDDLIRIIEQREGVSKSRSLTPIGAAKSILTSPCRDCEAEAACGVELKNGIPTCYVAKSS